MRNIERRGFIGFLLTMALGIALGTATLVVSKEIIKGNDKKPTPATPQSRYVDRAQALKVAWKSYDQARQAYENALVKKSEDVPQKRQTMLKSKGILEKAILGATPGVPSIPEPPLTVLTPAAATGNASTSPPPSGNPYDSAGQPISELQGR